MFASFRKTIKIRLIISGLLAILGLAWFCGTEAAIAETTEEGNIHFLWAFGALVQSAEGPKLESISEDRALKTGDKIKMMVEPQEQCFVYLLHHNAQGEMELLFPYTLDQFDTDYQVSKKYYIPQGNAWFELDQNVGKEGFYLLSSNQRLSGLETLLGQYQGADAAARPEIAKQIVAEIHNLKKQNRELATAAERPVLIGGAVRGTKIQQKDDFPDVSTLAVEVSASNFYGRTYTVDHQ